MKKYYLLILILFQTNAFVICMPDLEHCEQNYLFIIFVYKIVLFYDYSNICCACKCGH